MKSLAQMNLQHLAGFVCNHLAQNNVHVVLSGGAVVTIYTENKYQSFKLDLIVTRSTTRKQVKKIMMSIGFIEKNRYFKHAETEYFIEFPSGPLAVGHESVKEILSMETPYGNLKIISPTDSVKDRLSAYFYWQDYPSLERALWIAGSQKVDMKEIKRWSKAEGKGQEFKKFKERFKEQ